MAGLSGAGAGNIDISSLSDADKRELSTFLENETQKAQIQENIHSLTSMCFKKCITSTPSSPGLDKYEQPCMNNCVNRFLDANNLVIQHLDKMRNR